MTSSVHLLPHSAAPEFALPGIRFVGLASPGRHSPHLCTWQITVDPGLQSPTAHTVDRDEIFMVTRGSLELGQGTPRAEAGDTLVVPAGHPIRLSNPGSTAATAIVVIPAGFTARAEDGTPIPTPPWAE